MLKIRMLHYRPAHWLAVFFASALGLGSCGPLPPSQDSQPKILPKVGQVQAAPNGLNFPHDYRNWEILAVTHRTDSQTMRVVVGNDIAITAARNRNTNPWPDGTILGNLIWKEKPGAAMPQSQSIDEFLRAEFMFKDVQNFSDNNDSGWGWARWRGPELTPYGDDPSFDTECIQCHTKASGKDWVFSTPILLP